MKSKMKKSLFVTWIICVLFVMSAMSVQAAGKTGWVRKGTTYKYKVNNIYVKNEVKKLKNIIITLIKRCSKNRMD